MRNERIKRLKNDLKERVLVLDGAMGTAIHTRKLTAKDYGGELHEGCPEYLNITRPDVISEIHEEYLKAGADIIETNTFGGTPFVLNEFSLGDCAYEINRRAAEIARTAAARFDTSERLRYVAGSMGPTTKALSVTGGIDFDQLVNEFEVQARGLYDGGVDYFLIETCQDTRNIKAALIAIDRVNQAHPNEEVPVAVSGTIEPMGTMLAGQSVEALAASLENRDLLYLGLNCATGPEFMTDHIRSLSARTGFPVACVPNAGLPDEDGRYLESPEMMAKVLESFAERHWLNVIGGCCGTTHEHIRRFAELAKTLSPRKAKPPKTSVLSGVDFLEVSDEVRPVLVGERTNVIGSRLFKQLISDEKWEEASEIARRQVKNQAQIIDVCLANPDRDEAADMQRFLEVLVKKITVPLMIDSTDVRVIELALKYSQGKAIINSINLEEGEERFEQVVPLAKQYGAALIVGCIDDDPQQGMGVKVERKIQIAERSYDLLTRKYGIRPEDIYWDALVFPCGTGDPQYVGSGVETIEGVRKLKERFPGTKTVLGISNVSFGLPQSGREVLNSVFLYHCTKAGLDLAIVNTEKLERFAEIPQNEIKLCEDLLWNRGEDPVGEFSRYFGAKKKRVRESVENLSLDERLARYIVEGTKDGLIEDLNLKLKEAKPLEIINGPLMKGMDEVGKLFNENKLIVAEVLQSAEAMKAAVAHLEPMMEKTAVAHLEPMMEKTAESLRGRVLLATVKGDVHDIGKNLVEIILSNNGFEVINLGIKVLSQTLIEEAKKRKPQIIGLSGLLVKSAQQMVETASDFAEAGLEIPVLVGGAALTRNFVDRKIAPAYKTGFVEYARDAMDGLDLAKQIVDAEALPQLQKRVFQRRSELGPASVSAPVQTSVRTIRSESVPLQANPLSPPDADRHLVDLPLDKTWTFINPLMLLGRHLGVKGEHIRALDDRKKRMELRDDKGFQAALEVDELLEKLKEECRSWMKVRAVYQFVRAHSYENKLRLYSNPAIEWEFKRQASAPHLCLADYMNPSGDDFMGLFVTTVQGPVQKKAEEFKLKGEFLKSHALLALALETAEAAAEYLHSIMRMQWGFPDSPEMTMLQRFQAKYRGKRYSFGYPACPELEYQRDLFQILRPEEIGVQLTEGFMMSPEHSVSALVFSHPDAQYFGVGK